MVIILVQWNELKFMSKPEMLAISTFVNGGGHNSLISRVSPLRRLNRFQPEIISLILVVLNECEGPHCRTLHNFLVTQSLSHLITCQKKRFFASAQNDEKTFILSGVYAPLHPAPAFQINDLPPAGLPDGVRCLVGGDKRVYGIDLRQSLRPLPPIRFAAKSPAKPVLCTAFAHQL